VFESTSEACTTCRKKGLRCGEKTRRGGAQGTVRLSVLAKLAQDNPRWSLRDVIEYLNEGHDVVKRESSCKRESSATSARSTHDSGISSLAPDSEQEGSFNMMDYVHDLEEEDERDMNDVDDDSLSRYPDLGNC